MGDSKTAFKLFWAWDLDKETTWLESMERAGWRLFSTGFGFYRFTKGNPEENVYEIDFSLVRGADRTEYFTLYRDSGWEYVTSFGNWHYFRASGDTARRRPAYTDVSSRKAKLKRVLAMLLFSILPMGFFGIINPLLNGYLEEAPIYYAIGGFSVFIMLVCIYAALRLLFRIRRLGRSQHE